MMEYWVGWNFVEKGVVRMELGCGEKGTVVCH